MTSSMPCTDGVTVGPRTRFESSAGAQCQQKISLIGHRSQSISAQRVHRLHTNAPACYSQYCCTHGRFCIDKHEVKSRRWRTDCNRYRQWARTLWITADHCLELLYTVFTGHTLDLRRQNITSTSEQIRCLFQSKFSDFFCGKFSTSNYTW